MVNNDAVAIAQYEAAIADLIAQYRNTPSNQTSKLEALKLKIDMFKTQIANITAYMGK